MTSRYLGKKLSMWGRKALAQVVVLSLVFSESALAYQPVSNRSRLQPSGRSIPHVQLEQEKKEDAFKQLKVLTELFSKNILAIRENSKINEKDIQAEASSRRAGGESANKQQDQNTNPEGILPPEARTTTGKGGKPSVTDTVPPVLSSVIATNIQATSTTVTWGTNEKTTTQVLYGLTSSYGSSSPVNTTLTISHSQTLSNLSADTVYHYCVISKDAAGNQTVSGDFTFRTDVVAQTTLQDATLSSFVSSQLAADGRLDRSDMLTMFNLIKTDGVVSSAEYTDLKTMLNNSSLYPMPDYVSVLTNDVVKGISSGATSAALQAMVDRAFLGTDHPTTSYTYSTASGGLFVNGASYTDVNQGNLGDCSFMASLAETVLRTPEVINNMFIDNGDGTYTVRFFKAGTSIADYVTVDRQLPTSGGNFVYANAGKSATNTQVDLWVALAEKAWASIFGKWSGSASSYASIAYQYIGTALNQITGFAYQIGNALNDFNTFVQKWIGGDLMGLASYVTPASTSVVGNHAYAVVDYDSATQKFTLFNPWGIGYGLLNFSWSQIQSNFSYYDMAGKSAFTEQAVYQAAKHRYEEESFGVLARTHTATF